MNTHKPDCNCVICNRQRKAPTNWRNFVKLQAQQTPPPEPVALANAIVALAQALHHVAHEIAKHGEPRK